MTETHEFLMPDYFTSFACKMGKCRNACCEGWPVTISIEDYFKLTSFECCEDLRRKIDLGIKISLSPTPDAYAQITHRFDGNCYMRMEDGRCALQAEFGEEALSDVCRLYPRGFRIEPGYECSCSNSCEAILEGFIHRNEPIKFVRKTLTEYLPPFGKRAVSYSTNGKEQEIKLYLISIIQNRKLPLYKRIISLGEVLGELESSIENQKEENIDMILSAPLSEDVLTFEFSEEHLISGLNTIKELLAFLDSRSESVKKYGDEVISLFDSAECLTDAYVKSKESFENSVPSWEIFFEHILVNHMFFEQFPFQDRPVPLWNEYTSLCAVYSLMRFMSIGYMSSQKEESGYIDMCSAIFRLVDHSAFDSYAAKTLKRLNCTSPQQLFDLISL